MISTQVVEDTIGDLANPVIGEGVVLYVYPDSRGILTIGIGTNVDGKHGGGISMSEAQYLCNNRVERVVVQLLARLPWIDALDPVRQSAFVNLGYNMGVDGLLTFTRALGAAKMGDWETCANEFLDSAWAREVQPARRDRIVKMLRIGAR